MAVLQAINAIRTVVDPSGFASYLGAPAKSADAIAWVQVYGARAAFIAVLVTILLARRSLEALKWAALAAVVMPFADAWIAYGADAQTSIVGRHLATAVYLVVTFVFLSRAESQVSAS